MAAPSYVRGAVRLTVLRQTALLLSELRKMETACTSLQETLREETLREETRTFKPCYGSFTVH